MSDTDETDDEGEPQKQRGNRRFSAAVNGKKKKTSEKLTRSLPHESVISLKRNSDNDKSTSSADPSSSNTTGNNSVAPSTSSGDGISVTTKTEIGKLNEEKAALLSSMNAKLSENQAKFVKLQ